MSVSTIELRSALTINHAIQALRDGDFTGEKSIVIRFHTPFFSSIVNDDVKDDLRVLMGLLPHHLNELTLQPTVDPGYVVNAVWQCLVPVEAVSSAIGRARDLDKIRIEQLVLVGAKEKFQGLAESIKGHPALTTATFNCESREGAMPADANIDEVCETPDLLDPVIIALGGLTTLEVVEFTNWRVNLFKSPLSNEALAAICGLAKLKQLKILSFCITDDHLEIMSQQLRHKECLDELRVQCRKLGKAGSDAIKRLVRENKNTNILHFYVESVQDECPSSGGDLVGRFVQEIGGTKCKIFEVAVPTNILPKVKEHVRQMLRGNFTLESIFLQRYKRQLNYNNWYKCEDKEVEFLLKTNKLGRGQLFQQDMEGGDQTTTTWLKMLDATEMELNNIYYLVKSNPLKFIDMLQKHCVQKQVPDTMAMIKLLGANLKAMLKATDKQSDLLNDNVYDIVYEAVACESEKIVRVIKADIASLKKDNQTEIATLKNKNQAEIATLKKGDKIAVEVMGEKVLGTIQQTSGTVRDRMGNLEKKMGGKIEDVRKSVEDSLDKKIGIEEKFSAPITKFEENMQAMQTLVEKQSQVVEKQSQSLEKKDWLARCLLLVCAALLLVAVSLFDKTLANVDKAVGGQNDSLVKAISALLEKEGTNKVTAKTVDAISTCTAQELTIQKLEETVEIAGIWKDLIDNQNEESKGRSFKLMQVDGQGALATTPVKWPILDDNVEGVEHGLEAVQTMLNNQDTEARHGAHEMKEEEQINVNGQ